MAKFNLAVRPWQITRSAAQWVAGELVTIATDTFELRGSIQPVSPREAALMPDAYRTRARFKMYAAIDAPALRVAGSEESAGLGDFVSIGGEYCLVLAVEDWGVALVTRRLRRTAHLVYILAAPGGGPARSAPPPFDILGDTDPLLYLRFDDASLLFQDAAGTVPVTAIGDPVGLVLNQGWARGLGDAKQAVAARRPWWTGPGLMFEGGQYLETMPLRDPFEFHLAVRALDEQLDYGLYGIQARGTDGFISLGWRRDSSGLVVAARSDSVGFNGRFIGPTTGSPPFVAGYSLADGELAMHIDGGYDAHPYAGHSTYPNPQRIGVDNQLGLLGGLELKYVFGADHRLPVGKRQQLVTWMEEN